MSRPAFSRRLADAMQRPPLAGLEPVERRAYADRQIGLESAEAMQPADRRLLDLAER